MPHSRRPLRIPTKATVSPGSHERRYVHLSLRICTSWWALLLCRRSTDHNEDTVHGRTLPATHAAPSGLHPHDRDLSLIHISEPTRRTPNSYAVFCLKK